MKPHANLLLFSRLPPVPFPALECLFCQSKSCQWPNCREKVTSSSLLAGLLSEIGSALVQNGNEARWQASFGPI